MGGMFLFLPKDLREEESRDLAKQFIGNHVGPGQAPLHFQISRYLLSVYCVPSPGDIIINRYGICLHRAYRLRRVGEQELSP